MDNKKRGMDEEICKLFWDWEEAENSEKCCKTRGEVYYSHTPKAILNRYILYVSAIVYHRLLRPR